MRNLAGHPDATMHAREELILAGIEVVSVVLQGEVQAAVEGRLGPYTFRRAWYYWVMRGAVPLELAERMYQDPTGRRDVPVAGHCGCPPPAEWVTYLTEDGEKVFQGETGRRRATSGILERVTDRWGEHLVAPTPASVPGVRPFVTSYHIDSQEGLNLFVRMVSAQDFSQLPLLERV